MFSTTVLFTQDFPNFLGHHTSRSAIGVLILSAAKLRFLSAPKIRIVILSPAKDPLPLSTGKDMRSRRQRRDIAKRDLKSKVLVSGHAFTPCGKSADEARIRKGHDLVVLL